MKAGTPDSSPDSPERRRAVRRTASGDWRDLGVLCLGYGIGVAAAFLASGYEPRWRK